MADPTASDALLATKLSVPRGPKAVVVRDRERGPIRDGPGELERQQTAGIVHQAFTAENVHDACTVS